MSRERQPLCAAAAQPHTSCWQVLAFFEGDGDEGLQAFVEPFVIMLILVINAIVGVWQEHNAENALDALKEMQTTTTKVLRNGVLVPDVPSSELVPGDVVDVRVGDKVPADVRIIKLKTTTIKTDEGSLTGESETVLKQLEVVAKDVRIQGKLNMMFSGTTISNGAAIGVVTATGMRTEIGKIQANVTEAKEAEEKTPLHPPTHPPTAPSRAPLPRRLRRPSRPPPAPPRRLRAASAPPHAAPPRSGRSTPSASSSRA
jgi:magnesium-transporting ATPase (P-type)